MAGKSDIAGEDIRPSEKFKSLYYVYFTGMIAVGVLSWLIPVALFAPPIVSVAIAVILVVMILPVLYWIPKYYATIRYTFTDDDMTWRRGVWFRNTGIVPFNRITNIDIAQGPVSRKFGIAALKIQTAGYSGPSQRSSEIRLDGIEDFEGLRERIIQQVRGRKPVAVESYEKDRGAEPLKGSDVLKELVKIRKLLEKGRR